MEGSDNIRYDPIQMYFEYANKIGNRVQMYQNVANRYAITGAVYPGSHIDIAPSLVIPHVTYIDSFKGTIRFFKEISTVQTFVNQNKHYQEESTISFFGKDYHLNLPIEPTDLIISLYAGFVGQATKEYLKPKGILLANDSHGDATLAFFDPFFKLIGVIDESNRIQEDNLNSYFLMPNNQMVDLEKVKQTMKPPKYIVNAVYYLFEKIE